MDSNELFQLISGGGEGKDGLSPQGVVGDACSYYEVHNSFRADHISVLLKLHPDLSFNQLPTLCTNHDEDVRLNFFFSNFHSKI